MKKIFLYFLISFIISIPVSALEIGISPSSVSIRTDKGEMKCFQYTLSSDREPGFSIETRWSDKNTRSINDYYFYPEEKGIIADDRTLEINRKSEVHELCLIPEREGEFNGVLIAKVYDKNAAVGMWIELESKGNEPFFSPTANVINERQDNGNNIYYLILIESFFVLTVVLALVLIFARRKS